MGTRASLALLKERLCRGSWSEDADILNGHLNDWRGRFRGHTPLLLMPSSTQEVAEAVEICAAAGIPITPQGGNTGLVGGQIPDGEVLLSLKRLNRIRSMSTGDDAITVEAGVILSRVHAEVAAVGRLFPLSLASQESATVGGLISTNAGGVHVLRYGTMRNLVLGLEIVLPNGQVLSALSPLHKDNTGYDFKQLFIGGEGTLGIVTAATLKLHTCPKERVVAIAAVFSPEHALEVLHRAKAGTDALSAFELMNRTCIDFVMRHAPAIRVPLAEWPHWFVLLEFQAVRANGLIEAIEGTLEDCMRDGLLADVVMATSLRDADQLWHVRESISGALRPEGAQVNCDIAVPVGRVPDFLRTADAAITATFPGVRIAAFGHAGDGNIHYTVLQPEGTPGNAFEAIRPAIGATIDAVVRQFEGSISAEHGIGVLNRDRLTQFKSPAALEIMQALKAVMDPKNIMNPRVLLGR